MDFRRTDSKEIENAEAVDCYHLELEEGSKTLETQDMPDGSAEASKISGRTWLAIMALAITWEAAILSFVLPSAALLTIDRDIGPSTNLNWGPTAWVLCQAVMMTVTGNLSDLLGRRHFVLAGNALGLIGCVVASRASDITTIIASLALTGIGSAPQLLALGCAVEIVPKKTRGLVVAALNVASMPASCFGPVISFRLIATLNWRWTFYIGILANGLALITVGLFYWPPSFASLHSAGKSRVQQLKELDVVGLFLFAGGLTTFLLGIGWSNNPYSWTSGQVLAPVILGGTALFIIFPVWEVYGSESISKLCPPYIFKNVRSFSVPLFVAFVSGSLLTSFQVLWPQEVQLIFTTDPNRAGWISTAYNIPTTLGGAAFAFTFSRFGRTRAQFFAVTFLMTVFAAAMATVTQHTLARAIILMVFASTFVGATNMLKYLMIQYGAPDKHLGLATGLTGSATAVGGAVALVAYTTILRNKTSDLAAVVGSVAVDQGLPASEVAEFIAGFFHGAGAAPVEVAPAILVAVSDAVKDVYAHAFKMIYLVTLAFGVSASVAAALTPSVDHKLTNQVSAKIDEPRLRRRKRANM